MAASSSKELKALQHARRQLLGGQAVRRPAITASVLHTGREAVPSRLSAGPTMSAKVGLGTSRTVETAHDPRRRPRTARHGHPVAGTSERARTPPPPRAGPACSCSCAPSPAPPAWWSSRVGGRRGPHPRRRPATWTRSGPRASRGSRTRPPGTPRPCPSALRWRSSEGAHHRHSNGAVGGAQEPLTVRTSRHRSADRPAVGGDNGGRQSAGGGAGEEVRAADQGRAVTAAARAERPPATAAWRSGGRRCRSARAGRSGGPRAAAPPSRGRGACSRRPGRAAPAPGAAPLPHLRTDRQQW